jgi:hypothetical protein
MDKFFMVITFIFFLWVVNSQHQASMNATPEQLEQIRMETRARAIATGLEYYGE